MIEDRHCGMDSQIPDHQPYYYTGRPEKNNPNEVLNARDWLVMGSLLPAILWVTSVSPELGIAEGVVGISWLTVRVTRAVTGINI